MAQILIAEDEAFTAMALVDLLESEGHVVKDAADGRQAIDLLDQFDPDVVVTDLMMPKIDGYALIQHMHTRGGKAVPVILITGVPQSKLPADLKYDGYLGKPVDHDRLAALVAELSPQPPK
jgi:CheY-like chemotaxis protein